jgi:hypothetical protein
MGSQSEDLLSDVIRNNTKVAEFSDAYRSVYAYDWFTWRRGVIYSRLDFSLVSNSIVSKISGASIDWEFESTDNALVNIDFTFEEEPMIGPGIVKVKANILNDPVIVLQIGKEIEEMITDDSWDPHARLEFLKVAI